MRFVRNNELRLKIPRGTSAIHNFSLLKRSYYWLHVELVSVSLKFLLCSQKYPFNYSLLYCSLLYCSRPFKFLTILLIRSFPVPYVVRQTCKTVIIDKLQNKENRGLWKNRILERTMVYTPWNYIHMSVFKSKLTRNRFFLTQLYHFEDAQIYNSLSLF